MSLAALLNSLGKEKQHQHWSRSGMCFLSEALYEEDLWGLQGFGVPRDEYDWLAERCVALALGLEEPEDLWVLASPPPRGETSLPELHGILQQQVNSQNPFGDQQIQVPQGLACFLREALDRSVGGRGEEPIEETAKGKVSESLTKHGGASVPL